MAKKYSKADIACMKEDLYHRMCPHDRFCPDCPFQGYTCPDNLDDDGIIASYRKQVGEYTPDSRK